MTEAVINKHAKELINDFEIPKKEGKRRKMKEKDKTVESYSSNLYKQ